MLAIYDYVQFDPPESVFHASVTVVRSFCKLARTSEKQLFHVDTCV